MKLNYYFRLTYFKLSNVSFNNPLIDSMTKKSSAKFSAFGCVSVAATFSITPEFFILSMALSGNNPCVVIT